MGGTGATVGAVAGGVGGFAAGGPLGAGLGMAGGSLIGGMLDGSGSDQGGVTAPGVDPNAGRYDGPLADWQAKEDAAQQRQGVQANFGMANQDYANQSAVRSQQEGLAGRYNDILNGGQPSLAEMQLRQGQQQAMQAGQNIAANARGGGGNAILAERQAQQQAMLGSQTVNAQAGMQRVQEQDAARAGLANLYGNIRSGDLGARSGSQGQAMGQAGLDEQQRQANDAMSQSYLGAQSTGYGQQMQGTLGNAQINEQGQVGAMNANAGIAAANKSANAGFLGGLIGGGVGLAGTAMRYGG